MKLNKSAALRISIAAGTLALSGFLALHSQEAPKERVGPLPNGGFLLNSGWVIRPAGEQIPVDTFPMSTAVSHNGKYLLVLNGGYNQPSISVIEIASRKEINRTKLPDGWLGLRFAPDSDRLYVGGGAQGVVYELMLNPDTGTLTRERDLAAVPDLKNRGKAFIGDVVTSPDAHLLYAADLSNDNIAVINLQSGQLINSWKCGRRPYRLLVPPGGHQLFVTSWADAALYQLDANTGQMIAKTRIAPHTTDMVWVNQPAPTDAGETTNTIARVFVAASNTNSVYSLGVSKDGQLNQLESINVSLSPLHPLGMTPSALGVDDKGTRLYVVCSDANAVAVADITSARTNVQGFIPTGWYPTAVRPLPDGGLAILNGKGAGSKPNPDGPNPTKMHQPLYQGGPNISPGYVAHIQIGSVSFVPAITPDNLPEMSSTVMQNSPYKDEMLEGPIGDDQALAFTRTQDHPSPIQHVIYVIKENRTYDQVLGDLEKGNGDKSLVLFGEKVTPNQHQLARDFITYDNFYENADVSAEGHNWANAAIAPDYTVKTWPSEYAGRKKGYDYEGGEPANTPPAGYIWNNALQAGLTVRDYGEWDEVLKQPVGSRQIKSIQDPALNGHVDMDYRGWDLTYPDVDREHEFAREWKEFERQGNAPNLIIMRLGNDHTEGLKANALTPYAHVADNDDAVGLLVDTVSHSKLWSSTAIFIIEDDAQNGPDHVDSHRAPAYVISPYTRRGIVDSTMYNQTSVLRSIELILGLRPMTHFDAAARPLFGTFSRTPDTRPWSAVAPTTSMTERNPASGPGTAESARMDFSQPDKVDDQLMNRVLWSGLRKEPVPAPTRSAFVHASAPHKDDDD